MGRKNTYETVWKPRKLTDIGGLPFPQHFVDKKDTEIVHITQNAI